MNEMSSQLIYAIVFLVVSVGIMIGLARMSQSMIEGSMTPLVFWMAVVGALLVVCLGLKMTMNKIGL